MVEPVGPITPNSGGEDTRLPRRRGNLETCELLDDLGHPSGAVEALGFLGVLPAGQEPPERRGAHRLNLSSQPPQRVGVDARQEPPVAPGLLLFESAAEDDPLVLESQEHGLVLGRKCKAARASHGHRPEGLEASAEYCLGLAGGLCREPAVSLPKHSRLTAK